MVLHVNISRRTFIESLSDSIVPAVADTIMAGMQEANRHSSVLVRLFAEAFSGELFSEGPDKDDEIIRLLDYWADELDVKLIGFVSLDDRTYYDSFGRVLPLDYESERDRWVPEFLSEAAEYKVSFYEPEERGREQLYSLFHDRKIFHENGEAIGILGIGLDLGGITSTPGQFMDLISLALLDDGLFYRFPIPKRGSHVGDFYNLCDSASFDTLYQTVSEAVPLRFTDRRVLLHLLPVQGFDRTMMIEVDITTFLEDFRRQNVIVVISGLLLTMLIVSANFIIIHRSNRKMSRRAYTDSLTDCYNRAFAERLIAKKMLRDDAAYTLMIFDIDLFKQINDRRGHTEGDRILQHVASIASDHLRDEDFLIRWGGDEFVAILKTGLKNASTVADRIRATIDENTDSTISAGLSEFYPLVSFKQAFRNADVALYRAKEDGRNRIYVETSGRAGLYSFDKHYKNTHK